MPMMCCSITFSVLAVVLPPSSILIAIRIVHHPYTFTTPLPSPFLLLPAHIPSYLSPPAYTHTPKLTIKHAFALLNIIGPVAVVLVAIGKGVDA